ncbi:hypothetical protein NEOLI_004625 [Neolecta irregularis DAH-3]|uniref:Uncharacterized protein n=1 Tax=Neolecta irregularis (strain DAH-3) TaxID=1198029 RepID=A0A1U7LGU2_NEOID|nr:hypothetical protein NEOLI_004625 [Neolecta irregularis DAH-3]|eukprot:OLL21875.1 hypothetical protein NEOLI_004625 [Neolecta irregularis DAH-3]
MMHTQSASQAVEHQLPLLITIICSRGPIEFIQAAILIALTFYYFMTDGTRISEWDQMKKLVGLQPKRKFPDSSPLPSIGRIPSPLDLSCLFHQLTYPIINIARIPSFPKSDIRIHGVEADIQKADSTTWLVNAALAPATKPVVEAKPSEFFSTAAAEGRVHKKTQAKDRRMQANRPLPENCQRPADCPVSMVQRPSKRAWLKHIYLPPKDVK